MSARRPSPPGGLLAGGDLNSGAASTSLKNRATASIKYLLSTIITVQASFRLGHDFRRVVGVVVMTVVSYQPNKLVKSTRGHHRVFPCHDALST